MKKPKAHHLDNIFQIFIGSETVFPKKICNKFFLYNSSKNIITIAKIQLITVGLQNKKASFLKSNVEPPKMTETIKIINVFLEIFFSKINSKVSCKKRLTNRTIVARKISFV